MIGERERTEANQPEGNPERKSNETDGQPGPTSGVRPDLEKPGKKNDGTAGGVGKGY
ncbi:hypothetical protein QFW77_13890 [Luteimonas sp. RD2P54]|uniref:Uncharacterized protein n=1 Tax=Luteimonas endophytica TaxID=3042023 RepID=A0ABT6JB70_9GAMM|nr:hypothetical protein [Luteimonas endophytica]MDH5824070.1 hypothetical protein [Luteimonas endophytica]